MHRVVFEIRGWDRDDTCYEGDKYKVGRYLYDLKEHVKDYFKELGLEFVEVRGPRIKKVGEGDQHYHD